MGIGHSITNELRRLLDRDRRGLGALLYFTLLTVALTWPILPHLHHGVYNTGDPLLNVWILDWGAHALVSQPLELFDANIFFPYPLTLAYSESLLGSVLLAGPIIWLTHNPLLAANLLILIGFAVSGWGMYLLVARLTGSRLAALVAGSVFAFNPFRFAHIGHLQLATVQWMPFVFLFLDRLFAERRWRDWLGLTVTFNLQFLSSYYYGLFTALAAGVLTGGYLLLNRRLLNRRLAAQLAAWGTVTLAINLPLALPYLHVSRSMGFARSLEEVVDGSAHLRNYLSAAPGSWLYDRLTLSLREPAWSEHSLLLGVTAWGLAGVGVLGLKRSGSQQGVIGLYLALLIMAFVLSFGPRARLPDGSMTWLPYHLLLDYIPGFTAIRVPARLAILVAACVAVLGGRGMSRLLEPSGRTKGILTGLACAAVALEAASMPIPFQAMPIGDAVPRVYQWLARQPRDWVVLELPLPARTESIGYTEGPRLYYSTFHRKRLVNGYSGFFPPVYERIRSLSQEFPDQRMLRWLDGLRVNIVILHRDQYSPEAWPKLERNLEQFLQVLEPMGWFEDALVLRVRLPEWQFGDDAERPLFGQGIRLLGYHLEGATQPGEMITLRLFWQALQSPGDDYTAFVHVLNAQGRLVAQHDGPPQDGTRLTTTWRDGEVVVDVHGVRLPGDLPAGEYCLQVGLYQSRSIERLTIRDANGESRGDALRLSCLLIER